MAIAAGSVGGAAAGSAVACSRDNLGRNGSGKSEPTQREANHVAGAALRPGRRASVLRGLGEALGVSCFAHREAIGAAAGAEAGGMLATPFTASTEALNDGRRAVPSRRSATVHGPTNAGSVI